VLEAKVEEDDRESLGFPNTRRANRFDVSRTVRIVKPVKARGKAVNVSAVGILVRLTQEAELRAGDIVTLEVAREDGEATLTVQGKVVRVEYTDDRVQFAIDLTEENDEEVVEEEAPPEDD
jgi:lipopolysaccharide export system protein LptA